MTDKAPMTNNLRRYRLPALVILPKRSLPLLEFFFGTKPIQALISRPARKVAGFLLRAIGFGVWLAMPWMLATDIQARLYPHPDTVFNLDLDQVRP
jgi:hypothetical protein